MKLLYVLLDGVGDRPEPELNYLTPLEAAITPNLDELARRAKMGLVHPAGRGIAPESDLAVFAMLGYRFDRYFGRGIVEVVGSGHEFRNGELALRANFATVSEDLTLLDRRVGRSLSDEEGRSLAEAINSSVRFEDPKAYFRFKHTVSHRAALVIGYEGVELSDEISNTDPAYKRVGGISVAEEKVEGLKLSKCVPLADTYEARLSSELVNEFTEKCMAVLKEHEVNRRRRELGMLEANAITLRDAGNRLPELEPIWKKFGLRFAGILDMPVEIGVSRLVGMDGFKAGGMMDYEEKVDKAKELLEEYDAVYVHLKGTDEPGHDGDPMKKKEVIEEIDSRFFSKVLELDELLVVVSADHSTPCSLRAHSSDPVPLMVSSPKLERDGVCRFTEREARKGSLGELNGWEVMPLLASILRSKGLDSAGNSLVP